MFQRLFALIGYVPATVATANENQQTEQLVDLFSIYTSVVSEFLEESDQDWRSLKAIRTHFGFDKKHCSFVRVLLREAGARPSYRNKNLYGLKSRVGESGRRSRSY